MRILFIALAAACLAPAASAVVAPEAVQKRFSVSGVIATPGGKGVALMVDAKTSQRRALRVGQPLPGVSGWRLSRITRTAITLRHPDLGSAQIPRQTGRKALTEGAEKDERTREFERWWKEAGKPQEPPLPRISWDQLVDAAEAP